MNTTLLKLLVAIGALGAGAAAVVVIALLLQATPGSS
jgi:hypothetical protein